MHRSGVARSVRLTNAFRARRANAMVMLLLVMLLLAVGIAAILFSRIRAEQRATTDEKAVLVQEMTGLSRPIQNKLDPAYTDANGDLLADAPGDGSKQRDPAQLVFSYVASEQNADAEKIFKPLMDSIAAATGKTIVYLPVTDSDAQLHAMHDGKLDVCAFNTGAVPMAVDAAGFVPVALLGSDSGPSTYKLLVLTATKSGVGSVESLRGKELALTEMSSNSGFKAPLVLLQKKFNLRPGFDFGIRYSLGHQQSIEGLVDGTFETIAVASDVLARAEAAGTVKPDQYRILYTSDPFPTASLGFAHDLKPELAAKIEGALMNFKFEGNATGAYFATSGQTKFVKLDYKKDFAIVRDIDDAIGYVHQLKAPPAPTTQP